MRYEFSEFEWSTIKPMLPNKLRGLPRLRAYEATPVTATAKAVVILAGTDHHHHTAS